MAGEKITQGTDSSSAPVGAVMVVGGGVGGIQAALDLAEQGFRVYLVENKSAIGGHMAQLDKTFPTNDCAMCNLAPRLVEAGRHLNIEILTNTEVVKVEGEAGNFTATLRRKPRYIDVNKCVGCGDCANVCPVTLPNDYEEGLGSRRAAYRLYPQAVPTAFAIEKRGVAPCRHACPVGQRAQGYIALIAQGRYREALRVIKEDNPFPSVCGRTCHHPCEGRCTRAMVDGAVSIMSLKRFVVDFALAYGRDRVERVPRTRPEWVAVVGAGPAGLTAAHDLVRLGYGVTLYEALPVPGGMMRVGIPAHRLPKGVLQQDIDDILALGVVLKTNSPVHDPTTLLAQGYNAVCLATGISTRNPRLGIEGEDAAGAIPAATFLRQINLGEPVSVGRRVVVIGGGITAADAAAVARRLGAEEVTLVLSRMRGEIPAYQWEIDRVEEEGVRLLEQTAATRILTEKGQVVGVECARTLAGEVTDEQGRRRPRLDPGTAFTLAADTVIYTVGQSSDLSFLDARFDDLTVDLETLASPIPGLFVAAGRKAGASFIIDAVALGHRLAASVDRYLQGLPLRPAAQATPPVVKFSREELAEQVRQGEIELCERQQPALLPVPESVTSFREVVLGLTERQARIEASRCLQCGLCSECLACVYACGTNAIDHNMVERTDQVQVGAVILAPGYQVFNAELSQEYGLGRYPNVVTSLQFERLLSASGPTSGHVQRPSDNHRPKKIAFLQCIGSRDQAHDYCSAVCCMYASKQAIMAKEHEPDTDVAIFLMDMRAFSKGYEEYYHRAEQRYGVRYVRCRVSAVKEEPQTGNLTLQYWNDSRLVQEEFDLVVLSVGMETSPQVRELAGQLGVLLDKFGFCHTEFFTPLQTSRPGIFVAGPFREPKDIPETVIEASGSAALAAELLAPARGLLSRKAEYPAEREVGDESPRVGVFVCHCGSNIAGFLDVAAVTEYARHLPHVAHAEQMLYTCSQDSVATIIQRIKELNLNRVVVAACTPRTHEPLFQDALRQAGLNPFLFEMANIRNQCSWVHSHEWDVATHKAKDLVRMSVARVARLEPLPTTRVAIQRSALVIGGGPAGMTAALSLAEQGFPVHLIEREAALGGGLRQLYFTYNGGSDPQAFRRELIARVMAHPRITVHLQTTLEETHGVVGNFTSRLRSASGQKTTIEHGVTIVATGSQPYRGQEYHYGQHPNILTQQAFGEWLYKSVNQQSPHLPISHLQSLVMIQCVGADQFCGRTCCTEALQNALVLKEINPGADIWVLYKDIRTYGFREQVYTQARRRGVRFVRYDDTHRPQVTIADTQSPITVSIHDPMLGQELRLPADYLVLSTPPVPATGVHELAQMLKVPTDAQGFFLEAHVKLRPVDFASEGVFMAGSCHYPKFLDEAIAQAQAAAARAANFLSKESLPAGGPIAIVEESKCTACLTCVRVCPYNVPAIRANLTGVGGIVGAAYIDPVACHGCGQCVAECPARAINLMHYRRPQTQAKVVALFEEVLA